jgi:hypothetical protein
MQADLAPNKFLFFAKKQTNKKRNIIVGSYIIAGAVILSAFMMMTSKSSSTDTTAKNEQVVSKASPISIAQNVEVFKYLSKIDTSVSHDQIKKDFPKYDVSFKEFTPLNGWMKKDNLLIYFNVNPESFYISYNGMKLADAYLLKEAFDSVAVGYETIVTLDKDSVNIVVSNYKSQHAQVKNYIAPSLEESVRKDVERAKIEVEKRRAALSSSAIQATMDILQPIPPAYQAQNVINKNHETIDKMKVELEIMKIKGLILQEKLKQDEMIKKYSKP